MEFVDHCEITQVHQGAVDQVRQVLPPDEVLSDLADLFKIFGDSTRIRILFVLFEAEVCVCDLAEALNMTQSAISHQLRILKQSKLVKAGGKGNRFFIPWRTDMCGRSSIRDWSISKRTEDKNGSGRKDRKRQKRQKAIEKDRKQ